MTYLPATIDFFFKGREGISLTPSCLDIFDSPWWLLLRQDIHSGNLGCIYLLEVVEDEEN